MFGMSMGEILVILVIALLFLGPDKLPDAAKAISKGIRDFRKQTRELQDTIEDDAQIGGALRDLRSALRGEEPRPPPLPPSARPPTPAVGADPPAPGLPAAGDDPATGVDGLATGDAAGAPAPGDQVAGADEAHDPDMPAVRSPAGAVARPAATLSATPAPADTGDGPPDAGGTDAARDPGAAGQPPGKAHG